MFYRDCSRSENHMGKGFYLHWSHLIIRFLHSEYLVQINKTDNTNHRRTLGGVLTFFIRREHFAMYFSEMYIV